jgi:pimeloyl-ACP methyl ester carboxylesterase
MVDSWGDGWNGNSLTIDGVDYTIAGFASAESFVICVDLSTFGNSDGKRSSPRTENFDQKNECNDLISSLFDYLIEKFNRSINLFGWDIGGNIVLHFS